MNLRVCVVGRGKVGRTLQRALIGAGARSELVRGRNFRPPASPFDVYLLAVPDACVHPVAQALAARIDARATVLHCAGARGLAELAPLAACGVHVGVFHPLVSFARAGARDLLGATIATCGDARAKAVARRLARVLGARCVVIAPGPAYHAGAALVANGSAALAYFGTRILIALGLERRAAERALAGLLRSVADNVAQIGVPAALTGPVVRGDKATIAAHLRALAALDPALMRAYERVQPLVIATAEAAGLAPQIARKLSRTASAPHSSRKRTVSRPARSAHPSRKRAPSSARHMTRS